MLPPLHTHIYTRKMYSLKQRSGSGGLESPLPAGENVGPSVGWRQEVAGLVVQVIIDLVHLGGSNAVKVDSWSYERRYTEDEG